MVEQFSPNLTLTTVAVISQIIAVSFVTYLFISDRKPKRSPRKSSKSN